MVSYVSVFLIQLLVSTYFVGTTHCRDRRHVIKFLSPPGLSPSSLAWDPVPQHFLVGSLSLPTVSSIADAGVLETLIHDDGLLPDSSFRSISIDRTRRRLLVVVDNSSSPSLAAYDLKSPRPYRRLLLARLPSVDSDVSILPSSVTIDESTGSAYVTSQSSGVIWKVDLEGEASIFSASKIYGGEGLHGIVHVGKGYFLVTQGTTGKIFKVDSDDARARAVSLAKDMRFPGSDGVAVRSDGSAVVVGEGKCWILKSEDGWMEAGVYDDVKIGGEGGKVMGVTVREGRRICVLYRDGDDWSVEEVESDREVGGEWTGALIMVGVGLVVFVYWRFQMKQLVSNMNKKSG